MHSTYTIGSKPLIWSHLNLKIQQIENKSLDLLWSPYKLPMLLNTAEFWHDEQIFKLVNIYISLNLIQTLTDTSILSLKWNNSFMRYFLKLNFGSHLAKSYADSNSDATSTMICSNFAVYQVDSKSGRCSHIVVDTYMPKYQVLITSKISRL